MKIINFFSSFFKKEIKLNDKFYEFIENKIRQNVRKFDCTEMVVSLIGEKATEKSLNELCDLLSHEEISIITTVSCPLGKYYQCENLGQFPLRIMSVGNVFVDQESYISIPRFAYDVDQRCYEKNECKIISIIRLNKY